MDIIVFLILAIIIFLIVSFKMIGDKILKTIEIDIPDPDIPYSCKLDGCGPDIPCPLSIETPTTKSYNPANPWPNCYLYQGRYMCCQKSPLH